MGCYPWPTSELGAAYARIAEASTSFPVPPEGPDSGRRVSPVAVPGPLRAVDLVLITPHPPQGVVPFVALAFLGHLLKRGWHRIPPWEGVPWLSATRLWLIPASLCHAVGGLAPHAPHFRVSTSRDRGRCLVAPTGQRVQLRPMTHCQRASGVPLLDACTKRSSHVLTDPSMPRDGPARFSPLAESEGAGSPDVTLVVARGRGHPFDATAGSTPPEATVYLTM